MERHNYGRGEYKYFSYPLPAPIEDLRTGLYEPLAAIANRWLIALGAAERVPAALAQMLAICAEHDQSRPTALLLKYGPGDFNCLHQDVYGEIAFPFQVTLFLNEPHEDFEGGEFVLVEQRPRAQSRPEVVQPRRGDMIVFPNRYRPVRGRAGNYRVAVRHGVSRLRSGERFTLGIIFHDAK
ncbi:MAG TPA: 2OG-Fe(II) oxygenase [Candidatus Acidoferrales bacterium]|nr:2OG-Fe(II) oxygenase [Candidatus Acidoferrales bacterium]